VSIRFLADEDVDIALIRGLRLREPSIDLLDVKSSGLRGTKDSALLAIAADQDRIVITHDRKTMISYFCERLAAGLPAPGLIVIPQQVGAIGPTIEWLLQIWAAANTDEWCNRIVFGPPPR
jgi:hypothetical protein